jgi:prepilin peptidase CpaA
VPADNATWISIATPVLLIAVLAVAVRHDLASHRIPNWLTFGALGAGVVLAVVNNGTPGLLNALAGAFIGLACLIPLYLAKGMGAGDVKMMAAVGAFLGPYNAIFAVVLTLAAGAIVGIAVVAWRRVEMNTTAGEMTTAPLLTRMGKERFPYAVAIATGVIATLWLRGLLKPLAGSFA